MNEADIDFNTIEHLDFDVTPDKGVKCVGTFHRKSGQFVSDRRECSNQAVVYVIYSCCGKMKSLCMECYNALSEEGIANHVDRETFGEVFRHKFLTPRFSQVHFI